MALLASLVAALWACPADALAHAGVSAPAATSYLARITRVPPGVEAKVVDGDQQLWLRASRAVTVVVTGLRGEPYLRFSPSGVWLNERSPTAYLNARRPQVPPPGATPSAAPRWHRVSSGHSYLWHEDRLHALAVTGRGAAASYVGAWMVPLTVNGRSAHITGGLWHARDPSVLWFWPILVIALCCVALLRARRPDIDRGMAVALTITTLSAIVLARAGRGFYGRPTVSTGQLIEFGVYAAFAVTGLILLLVPNWRDGGPAIAAVMGLTVGLGLLPVLTHGFVLSALPATVERAAVSATLAGSVSSFLVLIMGDTGGRSRGSMRGRRAEANRAGTRAAP